jgi:hypothetical protein
MLHSVVGKVSLLLLLAVFLAVLRAGSLCDDSLEALHQKPGNLEFLGCKQRTDLQGEPWQASYRVAGARAAEVESHLAKAFKIKKLHRTCCVWESVNNSYRDKQDRLYAISMSTEETTIGNRKQWKEIPYFYVTVNRYRDDP